MNKYRNIRVEFDGHKFASKCEAKRYMYLKSLENRKLIEKLAVHPEFAFEVNGMMIGKYIADFSYFPDGLNGKFIVEDVKSPVSKTPVYRLKKKLMFAIHGIEVTEIE